MIGPLILIFIGGVFLLQNTGYLPPNFWVNLWRLWPLLLVLVGLELLFAHRIPWLVLAGLGAVVLVAGAAVVNARPGAPAASPTVTQVDTDLGGATQAAVTVRFGAGQLDLNPLAQPRPGQLANVAYSGPADLAPRPNYTSRSGGLGQLEVQPAGRAGAGFNPFGAGRGEPAHLTIGLAPDVPITSLIVQTGATDAHVDLSTLKVGSVEMAIGAATASIRLPENAGVTAVRISGGASTITIEVPQGVAARIQHQGGLSTLNINQTRFPAIGNGVYSSTDYDTAANKVDISLETGVSTIQVN